MVKHQVRGRFWVEMVCGLAGSMLFVVILFTREWIEAVFGVDPDGGSGALEFAIAIGLLAVAGGSSVLAQREWRRPASPLGARS